MMPVLFKIPGIGYEVPGYGLALMIGFLLSILWAAQRAVKSGANPDVILNCGFVALIGGIVGSRAMYVIHYWNQYADRGSALAVFFAIIDVRKGGLEVYGGVITVVLVVLIYLWWGKHSIRWYLDIAAPSTALGMAIGRIGCFVNGCCWGGVCDLPWAVQFPFGSPTAVQQWQDREPGAELPAELLIFGDMPDGAKAVPITREALRLSDAELDAARAMFDDIVKQTRDLKDKLDRATDSAEEQRIEQELRVVARQALPNTSPHAEVVGPVMSKYGLSAAELRKLAHQHPALPVHPTQLYSLITLGLLALMLNALYWRRTRDGQVILTLLLIEPPTRWAIELMRADQPLDTAGLTISQFLAICISLFALLGLIGLRYLPPRSPRAVLWEPEEEGGKGKQKAKGAPAK